MGKPRLESKEAYSGFTKPQSWGLSLSRPGFSDPDYLLGLHFTAEETASELSNRRGVAQLDSGAGGIGARPRRRPWAAGMQRPGPHSGHRLHDGLVRPARRVRGVPGRVEPEDGEEVWEEGREGAWGSRSLSRPGQREPRLPSRPAWVTRLARTVPWALVTNLFHSLLTQIINCFWGSMVRSASAPPGVPRPRPQARAGRGLQCFSSCGHRDPVPSSLFPGRRAAHIRGACLPLLRAEPELALREAYERAPDGHLDRLLEVSTPSIPSAPFPESPLSGSCPAGVRSRGVWQGERVQSQPTPWAQVSAGDAAGFWPRCPVCTVGGPSLSALGLALCPAP